MISFGNGILEGGEWSGRALWLTGKVEVSDAELGALYVDGEVDFASSGKILDVAVTAVFRATGDRSSALFSDFLFDGICSAAGMDVDGLWWFGYHSVKGIG